MFGIIFYPPCKLDYFSDCLEIYYKYLELTVNVSTLVRDIRQIFYLLYDKYSKFYGLSFNINFEQDTPSA